MTTPAIPVWNSDGVIPPINRDQPVGFLRSPYRVSLADMVLRFGTSPERCRIIDGLLRYRAELHRAGLIHGFQWLDGSFLEDVERLEGREPRDIDVVTFLEPQGFTAAENFFQLLGHDWVKLNFFVDHYVVELDLPGPALVAMATYWYSLWSHRREQRWKGYLQIDLSPAEDGTARANLDLAREPLP